MKNFFIKLPIFSFCILILNFCWVWFMPVEKQVPFVWLMLVFFIAMAALFHFLSIHISKGKPKNFILYYTGASALRLILYTMIIIIYRFYDKSTLIPFAIGFLVHYFLFSAFEIILLLKELKRAT